MTRQRYRIGTASLLVDDATGMLVTHADPVGADVELGDAQIAGDDANHVHAIPAGANVARINAKGGDLYWRLGGVAALTSGGRIPKDGTELIPVDSTSSLNLYIPSGSTACIKDLARS